MTLWLVFVIVYASIANLAMYMTCREHALSGGKMGWTIVGVAACVVWPLVIAAMVVMARKKAPVAA